MKQNIIEVLRKVSKKMVFVLVVLVVEPMIECKVAYGQTAFGEIEERPAPVSRSTSICMGGPMRAILVMEILIAQTQTV